MKRTRTILMAAALAVTVSAGLALAGPDTDVGFAGWGPRVGLSLDPDQIHFGAHIDFGNFAKHVRFQPNMEMGFGDNLKLFTLNAEAAYRFSSQWDVWTPYLGGGIGANIKSVDNGGATTHRPIWASTCSAGLRRGSRTVTVSSSRESSA